MVFFALIPALVGIVVFTIINGILTKRRNAQKAKALNCQLPKQQANRLPLGIDHIQAFLAAMKNENFPNLAVEMFSDLGTTFEASILGGTGVFTVDEQNIQAILATQFSDFDVGESRRRNANPFVGSGVFTQDGKAWEHSRAMLRPQFAREQVSDLELEEKHVQNLFRVLPVPRSSDGWTEELDIQPLFFNLTLDAAADFLLGESTNSQLSSLTSATNQSEQNREVEEFARAFDISTLGIATRYAFGPFSGLVFPPGWRAANATCHRFVDGIVSRHLSRTQYQDIKPSSPPSSASTPSKRTPYVFLHALATSTRDPLELRSQLLHILIAGRDTTAVLLGWVFFSLSRNPSIYSKLRRRILEDFGTFENCVPESDITFKKIKACEYLQWVLNESLRMYPPVPWNSRVAGRDTTLPVGGGGEVQQRTKNLSRTAICDDGSGVRGYSSLAAV
ncbi:hypothetical protein G7Y89_g9894 [Cudoniella acicularis]|uniref:Cytochrome P450 n=1 Tax=Cudoniella acicularis TaxID=354080 RepID=A0A8H4W252_9HELO|nr:hypothetical protein G7Y89_g9894 [Cudoniella acicularis]